MQNKYTLLLLTLLTSFVVFGKKTPVASPSKTEIDAAVSAAEAQGRIVPISSAGMNIPAILKEFVSLPVTFRTTRSDWNYDITVFSMDFTPSGSTLRIGCRFYLPNSITPVYFGAADVPASAKSGFVGSLPILMESLTTAETGGQFYEFAVPKFNNNLVMALGADTKLNFSCGAFQSFNLQGFLKINGIVEKEDADGNIINDGSPLVLNFAPTEVFDWQDIYLQATASSAFHAKNYQDIGFWGSKVWIDLSKMQNPANLPACASEQGNAWQGIYFESFSVRLPKLFKGGTATLKANGKNLFIDPAGLIGNIIAQNIFGLADGYYTDEIYKYPLSLDLISADYQCNGKINVVMNGGISLPSCDASGVRTDNLNKPNLAYNITYDQNSTKYSVGLAEMKGSRLPSNYSVNSVVLSTGSQLNFALNGSGLTIQGNSSQKPTLVSDAFQNSVCNNSQAKLTASNCSLGLKWSDGQVGKQVTVQPNTTEATATYSVSCFDAFCISTPSEPLVLKIYQKDAIKPTITAPKTNLCDYSPVETITLTASDNCPGYFTWSSGEEKVSQINVNQAKTYGVTCHLNDCAVPIDDDKRITTQIFMPPTKPTVSVDNPTICFGSSTNLNGSCQDNFSWQNPVSADLKISVKPTLAGTNTYPAQCQSDKGCISTETVRVTAVQAAANDIQHFPDKHTIANFAERNYFDVWAKGCENGIVHWSDGQDKLGSNNNGDIQLQDVGTYSYTYTCEDKATGCISQRSPALEMQIIQSPIHVIARADPKNIYVGGATHLYLENAQECPVGIDWYSPFDGSIFRADPTITGINENRTYRARCYFGRDNGNDLYIDFNVDVNVSEYPVPNIQAVASPNSVKQGSSTTLSLNGSEACTSVLWWDTPGHFITDLTQNNLQNAVTYHVSCYYGNNKEVQSSVTVSVSEMPAPIITAVASPNPVKQGSSTTLSLSGSEACTSVLWWDTPGHFITDLTQNNLQNDVTYHVSCYYGNNKEVQSSVTINVSEISAPIISAVASPNSVKQGSSTTLSLNGSEACTSVLWWDTPGHFITDLTQNNLQNDVTYHVSCYYGNNKEVQSSVTINVSETPVPTPTPSKIPNWVNQNQDVCVSGNSHITEKDTNPNSATYNTLRTTTAGGTKDCNCEGKSTEPVWENQNKDVCKDNVSYLTEIDTNPCSTSYKKEKTTTAGGSADCSKPCSAPSAPTNLSANATKDALNNAIISLNWTNNTTDAWAIEVERSVSSDQSFTTLGTILQTQTSFTNTLLTEGMTYYYRIRATNSCGASGYSNVVNATALTTTPLLCSTPNAPVVSVDKTSINSGESVVVSISTNCTNGSSLVWTSPSTSDQVGSHSLTANTNYSAKCVDRTCESAISSKSVAITQPCTKPDAPTIYTTNASVCGADKATLAVNNCSGTVNWSGGTNIVGAGTYTATCTNSCGTSESSNQLTIIHEYAPTTPLIFPSNGGLFFCQGGFTEFTTSGCNGNIIWSNGETGSSIKVNTPNVVYTVQCSNSCGTSPASNKVSAVLFYPPTISSNLTVSENSITIRKGKGAILSVSGCTEINPHYLWSNGATTSSISITPNASTSYTVSCTDFSFLTCNSSTIQVIVN